MSYDFHRDFYNQVFDSIKDTSVTFLLGTRKCGKTVCLHQLEENIEHTKYIDFKTVPNTDKQIDIFRDILDSINKNEDTIYLLDEITYVENAEARICEIANALTELDNKNTKLVFTGSQSVALNAWADRAFAGNAGKISVDFLTYSEFLRYKGLTEPTPETYNQFLYEVADFYKFKSLENYLQGCIEETIVSNAKASNCIFDNECDLIQDKVDLLINICYQTMFTLHNNVSSNTFFKNNKLRECEIDYINLTHNLAVELAISVKHSRNFEILPDYIKKLCLTRNENKIQNGIQYVDYCSYLFELSQSKYLSRDINIDYKPPTPQVPWDDEEIASELDI